MSRRNLAWLLGIAAVSLLALAIFESYPTYAQHEDYEDVALVVDVLQKVRQSYVKDLDRKERRKLVEDMVNGGLARLDPHSQYINAQEFKQFQKTSKGKFGGIGIQVGYDRQNRGQLMVLSPMVGTPAYDAGILAGDAIVKIDGKSTENMRMNEAVDMIQGDPGQPITLTVLHEGDKETQDVKIVRAEIKVQSVLGDLRKEGKPAEWDFFLDKKTWGTDKIAYIRLSSFTETATKEMEAALTQVQHDGARGVIIDLRNNPGGLLRAAVEIADLFLEEGRIVSTKGRNQKEEVFDAHREGTLLLPAKQFPVVILINRDSASASEILSAALQDNNRAVIIGERSYGKGSVQNVIPMEHDTSALKLTTASYWRPSGKNIHRFPDSKDTDDWGVWPNDHGYQLTPESVKALKTAGVPDSVLAKLKDFPNKRFVTDKEYLDELGKVLSPEEMVPNRTKFLVHADHGFEVPMTEEESLEYRIYRYERDVVRNKKPDDAKKEEKKDDKKEEKKKQFKDRVLEKAVEYLRQEIDNAGAGAKPFEIHDA
jgi:carboxyl-terminal processing protease